MVTLGNCKMKIICHILRVSFALSVVHGARAQPMLLHPPQNQTAIAGRTITFTVSAVGAEPLSYQWRSHTGTSFTNIPFGTESALVLTNVEYTTRRFSVVLTNVDGATTSAPLASITWLLAITSQPADQI